MRLQTESVSAEERFPLIQKQGAAAPMHDLAGAEIPWGTVVHRRLSKHLLFSIPSGAYVVCGPHPPDRRGFFERLGPAAQREETWRRAVAAKAAHHVCAIAWSLDQYHERLLQFGLFGEA